MNQGENSKGGQANFLFKLSPQMANPQILGFIPQLKKSYVSQFAGRKSEIFYDNPAIFWCASLSLLTTIPTIFRRKLGQHCKEKETTQSQKNSVLNSIKRRLFYKNLFIRTVPILTSIRAFQDCICKDEFQICGKF